MKTFAKSVIALTLLSVAGAAIIEILSKPAQAHTRITTDITWSEHVREILRTHCMTCHHPGGIAPDYVNLTVYGDDTNPGARAWAVAIEEEVMTGRMPPWNADPRFSEFSNAKQLSNDEKEILLAWIGGGAPQGPYRDLPIPEEFENPTWVFGEPDFVVSMSEPHVLPADQEQDSFIASVPVDIEEDTWITGFEFLPGSPKNIHSITAYLHDPEGVELPPIELEVQEEYDPLADDDAPKKTRLREMPLGPHFLGRWARGDMPVLFPDAAGRLLRKGSSVELRIEYQRPEFADWSEDVRDDTKLGLFVAGVDEEIDLLVESVQVSNDDFEIAADAANQEVRAELTLAENVHLVALNPRLGLLAKDLEARITYPDGRSRTLLWVPEFKRKWTTSYMFDRAIAAPAASRIELIAHYDNTEDNWDNPNSPPIAVRAGTGYADEQLLAIVDYMLDDHLNVEEEIQIPEDIEEAKRGGMSLGGAIPGFDAGDEEELDPKAFGLEGILEPTGAAPTDKEIYWCQMRGNPCELKDYYGPGTCDECFMELKPKSSFFEGKEPAPDTTDWKLRRDGAQNIYWCPNRGQEDHELLDYNAPGNCEVCGEGLLHKERYVPVKTYTCLTKECDRFSEIFYGPGLCPECGQPVTGMGHMDHNPVHGGQFFMADNMYHHVEGAIHTPGEFRMYFYDDWKNPMDGRNFLGNLFIEQTDETTGEVTEEVHPLTVRREGDAFLTTTVPAEFPITFYAKVVLAGDEKRFDFDFTELTVEPEGDAAGSYRLHKHDEETRKAALVIPGDAIAVVKMILDRDAKLSASMAAEDWLALHTPAFDAKDLVAALERNQAGLNVRQRGALKKAVGLINRGGNDLDRAGDAEDPPRVKRAYEEFSEGVQLLKEIYPDAVE